MHNRRNYEYNNYPSTAPSYSGRNGEFGNSTSNSWKQFDSNRCDSDSWRTPGRSDEHWRRPERQHFQYGRERAPANIDDRFLDRIGAKRLNNGNLVDRNGYTLRQRDYQCRAPSPPKFNPGREERIEKRSRDDFDKTAPPKPISEPKERIQNFSRDELDKRVSTQQKEQKKREKLQKKRERYLENRRKREEEGADEYEDVVPEPPKPPPEKAPVTRQRPLRPPKITQQREWLNEYEQEVMKRKTMLYSSLPAPTVGYYGPPMPPSTSMCSSDPSQYSAMYPNTTFASEPPRRPPQVDLPPPGIVEMRTRFRNGNDDRNKREYGIINGNSSKVYDGDLFVPSTSTSNINPFGIRMEAPPTRAHRESSSDSEEDEAIKKLKEIIKNYGSK